jgi:transposase
MTTIKQIGIDLHTNCFTIAYRDKTGNFIFGNFNLFKNDEIEDFKKILNKKTIIAVEATINSHCFYETFSPLVKKVIIVNTNNHSHRQTKTKSDKEDAKRVLIFLEADMLSEIWVAPKKIVHLRKLLSIQKQIEKIQTCCKNMLGNILIETITKRRRSSITHKDNIALFHDEKFDETQQLISKNLIEITKYMELKNAVLKHAIVKYLGESEDVKLLMSIPGISYYSAVCILAEIGDINRFDSARKLCSYAGLVPILDESNGKRKNRGITKSGRRKLRYFAVFSVLNAIKSSKTLREFYNRIASKGSKKRAMVATGRKLLTIIYHILTTKEPFREMKESLYNMKIFKWKKALMTNSSNMDKLMKKFIDKEIYEAVFIDDRLKC